MTGIFYLNKFMEYYVELCYKELYNKTLVLENVRGKKVSKYSDEDVRNCKKITLQIAATYFDISPMAVDIGMRNDLLPIQKMQLATKTQ